MQAYGSIFFCSDEDNENKYMGTFREALFEQRTGEEKPTLIQLCTKQMAGDGERVNLIVETNHPDLWKCTGSGCP